MSQPSSTSPKKWIIILVSLLLLSGFGVFAYQKLISSIFAGPAPDSDLVAPDVAVPPADLVMSHKKTQPKTVKPVILISENKITISSETKGASIGYKIMSSGSEEPKNGQYIKGH